MDRASEGLPEGESHQEARFSISPLLLSFPLYSDSDMKYTYEVPAAFPPSAAWYLFISMHLRYAGPSARDSQDVASSYRERLITYSPL
jgi:hypothetical protein